MRSLSLWGARAPSAPGPARPGILARILGIAGFTRRNSELVFPLPSVPPRIAVIGGIFPIRKNMREFPPGSAGDLEAWGPDALVASLTEALALADSKLSGTAGQLAFSTAIVIVISAGESAAADDDREKLWRAFGVPVFEQRRGADGAISARECEVHDGLHLTSGAAREPGPGEELVTGECECGSMAPRLRRSTVPDDAEADAAD